MRHGWTAGLAIATVLASVSLAWADCTVAPTYTPKDTGSGLAGNSCINIQQLPTIPSPHVEACSTVVGKQIWVVSGSVNSWSNNGRPMLPTARTDIFAPEEGKWYAGPKVNIPRINYPNVYDANGTLFLVGGYQETSPDSGQFTPCHRVEVCRPDGAGYSGLGVTIPAGDKNWHLLPDAYDMPAGTRNIWNRSNAVVNNRLYLFTPGQTLSFDTVTGVWRTNLATHAGANNDFSCAIAYKDQIYVSGGCGGGSPGCPEASLFARYDPATDTWTQLARVPNPGLAEHTMELVGNDKILIVGGDFAGTALYYYDPATNTMVQRESRPPAGQSATLYSRSDHLSGEVDGVVFVVGGIQAGTTNVQPATLGIGLP